MTTPTQDQQPKSSIATFSLILGILAVVIGFFAPVIALLGGLVALILGILALREIKAQGFLGRNAAIGGLITGAVGIGWFLFATFVLAPSISRTFDVISSSLP